MKIEIKWEKTEWANLYTVEIAKDVNFINIVKTKTLSDTKVILDLPIGKYYFHVCGINKYGIEGEFSRTQVFSITKNNIYKNKEFNISINSIPNKIRKIIKKSGNKPYSGLNNKIKTINKEKYLRIYGLNNDVKNIYYSINSGKFIKYTKPFTISEEGIYALFYYASDFVGNLSPVTSQLIIVDNSPPVVKLVSKDSIFVSTNKKKKFINSKNLFTFYLFDNLSGVKNCYYSINGEEQKEWEGEYFNFIKKGKNIISYFAIDNSLNKTSIITDIYYIDNDYPYGKINFSGDFITKNSNTYIINNDTKVYITANDNLSGVSEIKLFLNGNEVLYKDKINFSKGNNIFQFSITDNVGNKIISKKYNIIKDVVPPENSLITK